METATFQDLLSDNDEEEESLWSERVLDTANSCSMAVETRISGKRKKQEAVELLSLYYFHPRKAGKGRLGGSKLIAEGTGKGIGQARCVRAWAQMYL